MKTQNLFTALIFTVLISSCDHSVEPDVINYHNKILFTSSRSGKSQLYMMNPNGTDIKQITSGQYSHSNGRWSPDAKQIVAGTDENWNTACYSQLVVMNSDGTNRQLLGCGGQMSWSPDGKKIAFSFSPQAELGDRSRYIFIICSDGTGTIQLTDSLGVRDDTPSWSPDGTTIAFSSDRDYQTGPYSEIYLMDSDGNNQRRLTNLGLISGSPQWSPDCNSISFVANGICLINKDGTNFRRITEEFKANIGGYGSPKWSPDGNQLVITWNAANGNRYSSIFIINTDGSGLKQIFDDSTAYASDWSK